MFEYLDGQFHILFTKPLRQKPDVYKGEKLSLGTQEWLDFLITNPGAPYPTILKDWRWGKMFRC